MLCTLMVNQKNAMRENFTINTAYFSSNFRAEIERHMSLKTLEMVFPGVQISKFPGGGYLRTSLHMRGFYGAPVTKYPGSAPAGRHIQALA